MPRIGERGEKSPPPGAGCGRHKTPREESPGCRKGGRISPRSPMRDIRPPGTRNGAVSEQYRGGERPAGGPLLPRKTPAHDAAARPAPGPGASHPAREGGRRRSTALRRAPGVFPQRQTDIDTCHPGSSLRYRRERRPGIMSMRSRISFAESRSARVFRAFISSVTTKS